MQRSIATCFIVLLLIMGGLPSTHAQTNCPGSAPSRLRVGGRALVLPEAGINLRITPHANSAIEQVLAGETVVRVVDGPLCSDGYTWWQVEWQATRGWAVESFDENTYWLEPDVTIEAEQGNLRLSVPASLASSVQSATIQALSDDESPEFNAPNGQQFVLEGYPYPGTLPTITAYNAAAIRTIIPGANSILDALRNTLDNRPTETDLLLLPRLPVTMDIVTQIAYIDFLDGTGIRALIVLSPERDDPLPPTQTNHAFAYYLFQGLNADSTTYVQALLPLPADLLPAEAPDYDPETPNAEEQLEEQLQALRDTLSQATLSPDIEIYDRMMASLYTSATPPPMVVSTQRYTYGDALTLDYPVALAEDIELDVLNPAPERKMPRYLEMSLVNYPVIDFDHPPIMRIYRVADIQLARNDTAVATINELKNILLTKPEPLPTLELPMFESALQAPLNGIAYIRFRSGNGVMYLAAMVEEGTAVHSRDLLYVFQGTTNDGEFYIQGLFPVSSTAFDEPVTDTAAVINTLSDADFTPNLSLLRQMMSSMDIKTR